MCDDFKLVLCVILYRYVYNFLKLSMLIPYFHAYFKLFPAKNVIAVSQHLIVLKACLLDGFLMMVHVRLSVGAKAKLNSSLSL